MLTLSSAVHRSKWSQNSLNSWVILSSEFSPSIFVTTVFSKSSKSISPFEICFLHLLFTHYLCMLFQNCLLLFLLFLHVFLFWQSWDIFPAKTIKMKKWQKITWFIEKLCYPITFETFWNMFQKCMLSELITLVFACSWLSVIHQMDYIFYL